MRKRTKEKIIEFKNFNTEQKRWKLLAVFDYIKDNIDFADNAIAYLSYSPDNLVMDKLYEFIMEYCDYVKDEVANQIQEQKKKIAEKSKKWKTNIG